jgi:hypothetical protein
VIRQLRLSTGAVETIPAVAPDGGDVAMPLREAFDYALAPAELFRHVIEVRPLHSE